MKAIALERHGGPQVLRVREVTEFVAAHAIRPVVGATFPLD